jgi:hypothetical protein
MTVRRGGNAGLRVKLGALDTSVSSFGVSLVTGR